jgi:hypothetical protein
MSHMSSQLRLMLLYGRTVSRRAGRPYNNRQNTVDTSLVVSGLNGVFLKKMTVSLIAGINLNEEIRE